VITRAGFGDTVALTASYDGWPAGTVGRVRLARVGIALVEILDADLHTLDLLEVPYGDLSLVRPRNPRTRRAPVLEERPARPQRS
jgi:hypothetical protein